MKKKTNLDHTYDVLFELHLKDLINPFGRPTTDYNYSQAKEGILNAQRKIFRLIMLTFYLKAGAIGLLYLLIN